LNKAQYPSDVIALVVLWRLRYKLSLRDLAEMFLTRGFVFTYEAVREWEAKLTPALAENLRRKRKGRVGPSWYVDETYIRVRGQWRYLYRAIDRDGALVDVMLSEHRDLAAAKAFFRSAKTVTGVTPDRVTTDGHDAYPRAIRTELGRQVRHRTSRYLNNRLEQDHRGIKGRCRPMLGLKSTASATRYCRCHDELRNFLRCDAALAAHAEDGNRAAPARLSQKPKSDKTSFTGSGITAPSSLASRRCARNQRRAVSRRRSSTRGAGNGTRKRRSRSAHWRRLSSATTFAASANGPHTSRPSGLCWTVTAAMRTGAF